MLSSGELYTAEDLIAMGALIGLLITTISVIIGLFGIGEKKNDRDNTGKTNTSTTRETGLVD